MCLLGNGVLNERDINTLGGHVRILFSSILNGSSNMTIVEVMDNDTGRWHFVYNVVHDSLMAGTNKDSAGKFDINKLRVDFIFNNFREYDDEQV